MKKGLIATCLIFILMIIGCASVDSGDTTKVSTQEMTTTNITGMSFTDMVRIKGMKVTSPIGRRAFSAVNVPVEVTPVYELGRYEVTNELWYEVFSWATSLERGNNAYKFAGKGFVAPESDFERYHPVAKVNWRDALIWCNAYTEYSNEVFGTDLKCVYYADKEMTVPLRIDDGEAKNDSRISIAEGSIDNPVIDANADGFRLPTLAEWEFAARGGDPSAAAWKHTYAGSDSPADIAWTKENSGIRSHTVGTLAPNTISLYDMSGNVFEWCFDWYEKYSTRYVRGGAFDKPEKSATLDELGYNAPGFANASRGLRLARTVKQTEN